MATLRYHVYAPPMPATTLGNMVKTFLQKILDITSDCSTCTDACTQGERTGRRRFGG